MKVKATSTSIDWLTDSLRSIGFSDHSQIDASLSQVYEVHAVAIWSGNVFYQIIGDSSVISWMPSTVFTVVDRTMPSDWLANSLDEEVPFIVGPGFIVKDKEAYTDMVELAPEQVAQFMKRLEHRKPPSPDSSP